jgi:4-amino-4-deoxy-L-arabinose transferase-like glycosyltransferase
LVVLIGAALRFYRIGELPPGLYRDEGFYGLDALRILNGDLSLYFAANNGREGLFMYLLAASVALFGRTPEALRIASALVGTLTIVAIYFAARNMFSHRIGVLSAAILAITFWHVAISRVAFRAIALPLLLCVMMTLIFAALRTNEFRPRLIYGALAGVAFGLTFYTYTSAQFILPLVVLYSLSLWIGLRRELFVRRSEEARYRRRMSALVFVVAALVVLTPLLLWLTQHADLYFNRAGQVSILNPDINRGDVIGALLNNIGKAAGMFAFQGDRIWRHNLSLRPVFDGVLAVAFVIGLGVCVWRWWRSWLSRFGADILGVESNVAPQFILLWLILFLIPTILAEDAPHFLRAIGALPAACIIAAVGLEAALAWASRRGVFAGLTVFLRRTISPPAFIAAVLLALGGINTITDYFNDYVRRPLTAFWLEAHNVELANLVNFIAQNAPRTHIWLEDRLSNDNPTLAFLANGRWTTITVQGGVASLVLSDDTRVAPSSINTDEACVTLIADPNHDWTALRNALPVSSTLTVVEGPLAQSDNDPSPRRAFIGVSACAIPSELRTKAAFDNGAVLNSVVISPVPDESMPKYQVSLQWRTTRPITEDLSVFVHWIRGGELLAQSDGTPAKGYLPLPAWRVGDVIEDPHVLAVPGGAQPGDEIHIGLYRREGNRRLNVLDAQGRPVADSVIISSPR